jgi:L-alanine-DL-glutamate epimerase-like enolase superfamily enzyme
MGPVVYALSAIEIALWDIAGTSVVADRIAAGGAPRELTAYASLRYAILRNVILNLEYRV